MEQSEEKREREEDVLLGMEKEVGEKRQANASNQEDKERVETKLRKIEEMIDVEREKLLE